MPLLLSDAEQAQLAETVRVLLSPLDTPLDAWRAEVLRHLTGLLEADMGGFILPASEAPLYTLHNLPDAFAREFFVTLDKEDPWFSAIQITGANIWSTRQLARLAGVSIQEGWFASREYREFYSRYGIEEAIGYLVRTAAPPLPLLGAERGGEEMLPGAVLTCFHDVSGTDERDARGLAILRLLQPALEAGVAGRVRLAWIRSTLQEAFDVVRDGLQLRDVDGRRLHANAALLRMLDADPQADVIRSAMERVAGALRGLLAAPAGGDPLNAAGAASTEVATVRARYQVSGQVTDGAGFEVGRAIIVSVVQLTPTLPSPEQLQERWGLSPQEARVALLLAQGRSNADVAAQMDLSPATVRHYTESVFHKLGVHSRTEAAHRILME